MHTALLAGFALRQYVLTMLILSQFLSFNGYITQLELTDGDALTHIEGDYQCESLCSPLHLT